MCGIELERKAGFEALVVSYIYSRQPTMSDNTVISIIRNSGVRSNQRKKQSWVMVVNREANQNRRVKES